MLVLLDHVERDVSADVNSKLMLYRRISVVDHHARTIKGKVGNKQNRENKAHCYISRHCCDLLLLAFSFQAGQ